MEKYGNINEDSVCAACGSTADGCTDAGTPYCGRCASRMCVDLAFSNEQINKSAREHFNTDPNGYA